jgi:toxin ParE1/3/4
MAFQVVWSATAVEDLKGIVQYISLDDNDAAAKLADRIIQRFETASRLPYSNRVVPEKDEESIREAILKPYRLIYQIDSNRGLIHILRIWHAARGMPDIEQT